MNGTLISQLEERRAENAAASRELLTRAQAGNRDLTSQEEARYQRVRAEIGELGTRIEQLREDDEREARAARARATGYTEIVDSGSGAIPGAHVRPDVHEIRDDRRLRRGQSMREFLSQRIVSERMARGGHVDQPFSAGAYFRGMALGKWSDDGRDNYERRALAEGSVAGGGAMVPIDLYASLIDIVRNSARVLQAGATVVPLDHMVTNVAKLVSDPQPAWRPEGGAIASTGSTFDRVSFTTQTMAAVTVVSRELLEDVPTLGEEIQREMGLEFALQLDSACLYGAGYDSNQPNGLKAAQWNVPQTSMGTNGAAPSTLTPTPWNLIVNPCYRLMEANELGLSGAIMAPRTEQEMVDTVSTIGTYVEPPSRLATIARYGTAPLEMYATNQVPTNLTVGDAATASDLFVGDWSQLLVGIRSELKIDVLTEAYAGSGQVGFLGWMRADTVVARASAFDITTGIL